MYYELERELTKSNLSYDKQEKLAKQLVDLIDRKMRERAPKNLLSKSAINQTLNGKDGAEPLVNQKILTGLAITNHTK